MWAGPRDGVGWRWYGCGGVGDGGLVAAARMMVGMGVGCRPQPKLNRWGWGRGGLGRGSEQRDGGVAAGHGGRRDGPRGDGQRVGRKPAADIYGWVGRSSDMRHFSLRAVRAVRVSGSVNAAPCGTAVPCHNCIC